MWRIKEKISLMLIMLVSFQSLAFRTPVHAANHNQVVINEIAWSGTSASGSDEWIELYNNSSETVDLTGWTIEDDGSPSYTIDSGIIPAFGFFIIEDTEGTISNEEAESIIGLSLANSGDSLVLKDENGNTIDSVNSLGGEWFAGEGTSPASMERIDPIASGDLAENWNTANTDNGSIDRVGEIILGTPGSMNSQFAGDATVVSLLTSTNSFSTGDIVNFTAEISDGVDIFGYGIEIDYDPTKLNFIETNEGEFLSSDGSSTTFMAGLENGNEGKLIISGARLNTTSEGIDGEGSLFSVDFEVIGFDGEEFDLSFSTSSFIENSFGQAPAILNGTGQFPVGEQVIEPISNLNIFTGEDRYSLELSWDAPVSTPDSYIVQRKKVDDSFITIGQTSELTFIDDDLLENGGNLIPHVTYEYRVIAFDGFTYSEPISAFDSETRGLKGDIDRSDRVDGRDVVELAKNFSFSFGETGYDEEKDLNFDGIIDGNDLIEIGSNFALTY